MASQPINLTTYSQLSARFTLASPSPHTTLVQLLCMSSRVRNICRSLVYLIKLIAINKGEIHVEDNTEPGNITKLVAGDVIHFEEGTRNISTTPGKGKCK